MLGISKQSVGTHYKTMLKAASIGLALVFSALPSAAQSPSSDWNETLVAVVSIPEDGVARVNYKQLKTDQSAQDTLRTYLSQFEARDLSAKTPENFAHWINIYNALTIEHIVSRYPIDSIRDGHLFGGPWKKVKTTINGAPVSLHEIEHDILRAHYKDPRLHYALNCASYGCPNLKSTLWQPETLDADLDAAARAYINHPRGVSVTASGLAVSSIFKWYRDDFGGSDDSLISHLKTYADAPLAAALEERPRIRKYQYDWSLNDVE